MKLNEVTGEDTSEQPEQLTPAYEDTQEIKASVFPLLRAKIDKLNRKAARLHVPPIELTVEKEIYKEFKDPDDPKGPKLKEKYFVVKVEGSAPQVRGYKFMATIEHKDAGNIIRTVPGEENNPEIIRFYEAHPDYCDQCHKIRRRNDTFIVKNIETGQLRQIGRNCLADFLGGQDPKQILWYFSLRDLVSRAMSEASEEGMRSGRSELGASPLRILDAAAAIIRTFGYVKASEANEEGGREPTSHKVRWAIFNRRIPSQISPKHREELETILDLADHPSKEDQELVKNAIKWFEDLPQEQKDHSEFYHNIQVLLNSESVSPRDVGFLGALLPVYYRAHNEAKERANKSNEWLGEVGQKLPPTKVKCTSVQPIQTDYGVTKLTRMEDDKGNSLVWFNSGHNFGLDKDEEATIEGTVKKHDDYKGRKQTVLIRVKPASEPKQQKPKKSPIPQKPLPAAPEMKWDLDQSNTSSPQQPPVVPSNTGAGSKMAQATQKYRELAARGTSPSRAQFLSILMQPPFNMSVAGASTYYAKIKKTLG